MAAMRVILAPGLLSEEKAELIASFTRIYMGVSVVDEKRYRQENHKSIFEHYCYEIRCRTSLIIVYRTYTEITDTDKYILIASQNRYTIQFDMLDQILMPNLDRVDVKQMSKTRKNQYTTICQTQEQTKWCGLTAPQSLGIPVQFQS